MTPSTPLRIAVVQFAPKLGQVQANLARARELSGKLQPRSLDLVCFPEMFMSGESLSAHHWSESNVLERGYNFENAQAIYPHLELPKTGPTSQFCSELAERLKCYVFAGYPERLVGDEAESSEEPEVDAKTETPSETRLVGANSAVLYSPEGEWIGHYRKTNLFETDKTWAKAGTGFATFHLPSPLHTVCFGICNDLNPATSDPWTVEDGPYEIADYALSQNSDILILINAWLDSRNEEEEDNDWHTLNYWAARLRPLWVKDTSESSDKSSEEEDGEAEDGVDKKEIIVGVCNRTGEENGKAFAGSSAIYSMRKGSGRPKLLDMMGRKEEGLRVWNLLI